MSPQAKRLSGLGGGLTVTAMLFLFLLAGTLALGAPERLATHGAIRLSSFQEAPVREEEVYSTKDVPQVQDMQDLAAMDSAMEQPNLEMQLPGLDLDFAPELSGTLPMSGLLALSAPAAVTAPSGGALTLGEVDEMPRPIYAPPPLYPAKEKFKGREREVKVRIRLDKEGGVAEAVPVNMSAEDQPFLDAAVQAVRQWRFSPCRKEGKAVQCIADQPFSFTLAQ